MGIPLFGGAIKRDWGKLASAAAEAGVLGLVVPDGFSNAVSALFRGMEQLRGDDDTSARATNLVSETLAYAISHVLTRVPLTRRPQKAEAVAFINAMLTRAEALAKDKRLELGPEHLTHPESLILFDDAAKRIPEELGAYGFEADEVALGAIFRDAVAEGMNRVRARRPEYFRAVGEVLLGADASADARVRAWQNYRSELVRRFEDSPIFGEERVTIAQVYQPLRSWWSEDEDEDQDTAARKEKKPRLRTVSIQMLESAVFEWLRKDDKQDRIRLVSGGPGSGKSTFARSLAARLSVDPRWRVISVPLQRIRGSGALPMRIEEYFRSHLEEPFEADTTPLATLGRDNHRDWVVIFDGLDELAKEGVGSETAAQEFASALADWRGQIGEKVSVRFLVLGRAPSMQEARRRLSLEGRGTLHVADMGPLDSLAEPDPGVARTVIVDPENLVERDQRLEFWSRWVRRNLSGHYRLTSACAL